MEIDVAATLYSGKKANPMNSLLAMIDSELRERVINENSKN
ncbi:hypothetical protein [Metabacillus schmidteae]|nr:hypothetical protein [Metabacillus schmidteae]